MTHDHSFQLFSSFHSKIQTQTNCKEVWPCSTQCIFHCLDGDDAIIYRIDGSMRWESLSCVLVSQWESEEWPEQPPRLWQSCAWNKNWNNQQNQKDSSRFVWNKGLFLTGLAIHLASSLQEDTKTNPKLTAAMAEHSMLHASVAISLPFELSPWNWLKYVDIDFGIKHLARFEPFYQFILQNCYNLCPQLAKNS